jgi:hypothetical protein
MIGGRYPSAWDAGLQYHRYKVSAVRRQVAVEEGRSLRLAFDSIILIQ